jgi:hypothetical protein
VPFDSTDPARSWLLRRVVFDLGGLSDVQL